MSSLPLPVPSLPPLVWDPPESRGAGRVHSLEAGCFSASLAKRRAPAGSAWARRSALTRPGAPGPRSPERATGSPCTGQWGTRRCPALPLPEALRRCRRAREMRIAVARGSGKELGPPAEEPAGRGASERWGWLPPPPLSPSGAAGERAGVKKSLSCFLWKRRLACKSGCFPISFSLFFFPLFLPFRKTMWGMKIKPEGTGLASWISSSPWWVMQWGWAMSGGSRTWPLRMGEV